MKKSVKKVVIAVVSALAVFMVIGTSVAAANNFGKEKLNAVVESVAEDKKSVDLTITKNDGGSFVDGTDDMYIFGSVAKKLIKPNRCVIIKKKCWS